MTNQTAIAAPRIVTVAAGSKEHPRQSEASVLQRRDGTLLIIYQEYLASDKGSGDEAPNRLVSKISRDGGVTWTDRRVVVEPHPGDVNIYCPSLLASGGDWLMFYYRHHEIAAGKPVETTGVMLRSCDEGATFEHATDVWLHQSFATTPSAVKRLTTGRIVHPVHGHEGLLWTAGDHIVCRCLVSDDEGMSWKTGEIVSLPMRGTMEPHVEELSDGRLIMVMRTQLGSVFSAYSADGGMIWSKPQTTGLKAPESTAAIYRIANTTDLLMLWNDAEYDPQFASHYGKRSPLTAAISQDDGRTWIHRRNIEVDPTRAFTNQAVTFTREGTVVLSYWTLEYSPDWKMGGHIDLRVAVFDVDWLYS